MKFDDIKFISKRGRYTRGVTKKCITVKYTSIKNQIQISFYNQDDIILNKDYCKVGFADNRVYFMFTDDEDSYKLIEMHKNYRNALKICFSGKRAESLKSFISDDCYYLAFDSESGLYYIERNG